MSIRQHHEQLSGLKRARPKPESRNYWLEPVRSSSLDNPVRKGFRLNEWQVHPIDGSLAGPQGAGHLEPKVMEVLVLLASHPGQLVEREFLIREIWGTRTVSDEPLTRCIAVLRRTFGDSPKHPKCIQTVPKRGYRLVADVHTVSGTLPLLPSAPGGAGAHASFIGSQYPWHGAAVPDGSIAVLPFENLSPDANNTFLADGIQDDLLYQLARIDSIAVISRTSVLEYRGSPKNVRKIGQELCVAAIVEGGLRRTGDTVRVNVNLIDTQTDQHLWVETYDRQLKPENILATQREIATSIASSLQAELSRQVNAQYSTAPGLPMFSGVV